MVDLKPHPLVEALVASPAKVPDLELINGYLGASDIPGNVRLYLNSRVRLWLEVPENQVVHHERVGPNADSPFGEDIVWLNRTAADALSEGQSNPEARPGLTGKPLQGKPESEHPGPGPAVQISINYPGGTSPAGQSAESSTGYGGGRRRGPGRAHP